MTAFGYWPSFHEAPIIGIHYDRQGQGSVGFTLHGWEMTPEVDKHGYFKLIKHHLVRFAFQDISDADLDQFTPENILFELRFSSAKELASSDRFFVHLDSAMGGDCCGSFGARRGEVIDVTPCDGAGRRSQVGDSSSREAGR